jgi:hypothetical protein
MGMNNATATIGATALPLTERRDPPFHPLTLSFPISRIVTTPASSGTLEDDFEACSAYRERCDDSYRYDRRAAVNLVTRKEYQHGTWHWTRQQPTEQLADTDRATAT